MNSARKTVLITGAGRGIGAAIAERFMDDGCDVILNYRRSQGKGAANIEALVERAESVGVKAHKAQADISETREIEAMARSLAERGIDRIDHLVLNAASGLFKPILELDKHDWKHLVNTNLIGNVSCIKNIIPMMPAGSTIVAISSMGAHTVLPNYPLGMMKSALENLVRYMEVELHGRGIRVNGVCGGVVKSDMLDHMLTTWPDTVGFLEGSERRWMIEPGEIAHVVAFMASDQSSAICGQTVIANAGTGLGA